LWEPEEPTPTTSFDYILHVIRDDDAWLRACAALAAGQIDHWEIKAALETLAASDRDPLVRETADASLTGFYRGENLDHLTIMTKIQFLRKVALFAALPAADLRPIAQIAQERRYQDGEAICTQGEPGDRMYILTSGSVRVLVSRNRGKAVETARRGQGDVVGEMSIISGGPRMATLEADGDVRTLTIERQMFEKLLRERPEIALAVMRVLCARLREKD
jgi:hypothetical protein